MIIKLESELQDQASEHINVLYREATEFRSTSARNKLKKLYDDDWNTIKERFETEGSVWYVWYMDGVNQLLRSMGY